MADVDDLCGMFTRAGVKWTRDNNQTKIEEPRSAFIVYVEQPRGRLNDLSLYCLYDFDADGNLLGVQMSN